MRIAHIHVDIAPNGVFIYDRKLRDGSGSSIYGVEVCESLGMPPEFIKMAQQVRKHILEITPISSKKSSYNSQVYIENCGVCNKNSATEVHHIKYQCHGGNNSAHNLVPLCTQCHNEEHNGYLNIKGYIMTSYGRQLDYEYNIDTNTKETIASTNNILTNQDINNIKTHVKYSIAGWFIKKTQKGRWQLVSPSNVLAFIESKFTKIKIEENTIDFLKTHLLVV